MNAARVATAVLAAPSLRTDFLAVSHQLSAVSNGIPMLKADC